MPEIFDAYHKWLGIPPAEQPPDHYRLLGVRRFESDLDVIEHAADQRMAHIRSFQSGPHADQSQRLLNELSTARRNLLDSEWKAKHDEALRAPLKVQEPGVAVSPPPPGQLSLPGIPGQTPPEIPCPVCGGPMPGQYRKCMHCRSELVWSHGMPYDVSDLSEIEEMPLYVERDESEESPSSDVPPWLRPNEQQMEATEQMVDGERTATRMAKELEKTLRDDANDWEIQEPAILGCISAMCWTIFVVLPFCAAELGGNVILWAVESFSYFFALWLTLHCFPKNRSIPLAVGVCLLFGISCLVLQFSFVTTTWFGVSAVVTVSYLGLRDKCRL